LDRNLLPSSSIHTSIFIRVHPLENFFIHPQ
jgi:hypothetical protein